MPSALQRRVDNLEKERDSLRIDLSKSTARVSVLESHVQQLAGVLQTTGFFVNVLKKKTGLTDEEVNYAIQDQIARSIEERRLRSESTGTDANNSGDGGLDVSDSEGSGGTENVSDDAPIQEQGAPAETSDVAAGDVDSKDAGTGSSETEETQGQTTGQTS